MQITLSDTMFVSMSVKYKVLKKKKKSKKAGVCSYVNYAIDHILSWGLSVIFKQNVVSFT